MRGNFFCQERQFYTMVVSSKLIRSRPSALLLAFAPVGSLKDKFNTFILKNKLIAKSIEGIFTQKSSLEQLRTMVLVLK
jgi:hypothetical protein